MNPDLSSTFVRQRPERAGDPQTEVRGRKDRSLRAETLLVSTNQTNLIFAER